MFDKTINREHEKKTGRKTFGLRPAPQHCQTPENLVASVAPALVLVLALVLAVVVTVVLVPTIVLSMAITIVVVIAVIVTSIAIVRGADNATVDYLKASA